MYTSPHVSAWATRTSLLILHILCINSAPELRSRTWTVFCQGVNTMQLHRLFEKVCTSCSQLLSLYLSYFSVYGKPLCLGPVRLPPSHGAIPGYMLCECPRLGQGITGYPIIISDDEDNMDDKEELLDPDDIARPAPRFSTDDGFKGAIISIGPETDYVLSQYKIPDNYILRLRVLSQTVRSSNWKYKLRTADYGLTLEQALHVSEAMIHDIENRSGFRVQVVSIFPFF